MIAPATCEIVNQILDLWDELTEEEQQSLSAEDLVERDENLRNLVHVKPASIEEANIQLTKLRRFSQFEKVDTSLVKPTDQDGSSGTLDSGHPINVESNATIEREIYRGGLGIIYTAKERGLKRRVAVKISQSSHLSREEAERFREEALITSQLNHPGITQIYGIGNTKEGLPCYTMRLIDGDSLSSRIADFHRSREKCPKQLRELLRCFITVCRTLQYVHDQGVVHCDVKPLNISVGKYGDTILLDWGEAVSLSDRIAGARVHQGRKSPAYAAPDLAIGSRPHVSCDTYSAGIMLTEILTGDLPESLDQTPTNFVPSALGSVIEKAIQPLPADRYARIEQLADDVQAWLDHDKVSVHKYSWKDWLARCALRYDTLARIAIVSISIVLFFLAMTIWHLQKANKSGELAQQNMLRLSSGLAAEQVANEFRFVWNAIEILASDQKLIEQLSPSNCDESENELHFSVLQQWLESKVVSDKSFPNFSSVFILNRNGVQLAKKLPEGKKAEHELYSSLGENFTRRTYFGKQSTENETFEIINKPTVSLWYQSSTAGKIRIALSVPIKANSEVVGVVGLSLDIDDLSFVSHRLLDNQVFSIVDTRIGESSDDHSVPPNEGLIAFHPGYRDKLVRTGQLHEYEFVSDDLVKGMKDLRDRRIQQGIELPAKDCFGMLEKENYDPFYQDPVNRECHTSTWKMAYEPVIVKHQGKFIDTGLVVMVQEK